MRDAPRIRLLTKTFWPIKTTASAFSTALSDASNTIRCRLLTQYYIFVDGFSSAEEHKEGDCCGDKKQIGATFLNMSTVELGWKKFCRGQI